MLAHVCATRRAVFRPQRDNLALPLGELAAQPTERAECPADALPQASMRAERPNQKRTVYSLRFHIRVAVPTLSIQTRVGDSLRLLVALASTSLLEGGLIGDLTPSGFCFAKSTSLSEGGLMQEPMENVVGAAISRPYSLMHKHGGRPMTAPTYHKSLYITQKAPS